MRIQKPKGRFLPVVLGTGGNLAGIEFTRLQISLDVLRVHVPSQSSTGALRSNAMLEVVGTNNLVIIHSSIPKKNVTPK